MEIEQIRKYKSELETRLRTSISNEFQAFAKATGVVPEGLDIHMLEVTRLASEGREYMLGQVSVILPRI